MSILQFHNVSYFKDEKYILKDITLNIEKGDFVSIIGPSGSGKSTFLKLCCHLISPTSGSIKYLQKDLMDCDPAELRKNIGYCFQTPHLFGEHVMDNLSFPYLIRDLATDKNRINLLFSEFHMDMDLITNEVKNLSGGEKQRIALIRTLLIAPEILLLDEVTSSLDSSNTDIVENAVNSLNKAGITVIWVTHNLEQSRKFANKIITIEAGRLKSVDITGREA
ncbi:MAG: ATP-binding cassette domain-containing protein [Bacillota bacterium]|nr:ATP-binding cassette domain-containing protein [Bacillota bacterium]